MSGSIGGVTASNNKSGSYFRQRKSGTQPNSIAQLKAKSNFGSGAGIFRTFGGAFIAVWNGFAQGIFSPKNKANTGQYSGQNAFQSLMTCYNNAIASNRAFTVLVNGAILATGETFVPFIGPVEIAPTLATNSNLLLRPSGSASTSVIGANVFSTGLFDFTIQVGDGTGADIDNFKNSSGAVVGYATFMSSGNPTANMNYKSKERYCLGYFEHVNATAVAELDGAQNFKLTATEAFPIAEFKTFASVGQTVLISVYAVDASNQMSLVGRVETVVAT